MCKKCDMKSEITSLRTDLNLLESRIRTIKRETSDIQLLISKVRILECLTMPKFKCQCGADANIGKVVGGVIIKCSSCNREITYVEHEVLSLNVAAAIEKWNKLNEVP